MAANNTSPVHDKTFNRKLTYARYIAKSKINTEILKSHWNYEIKYKFTSGLITNPVACLEFRDVEIVNRGMEKIYVLKDTAIEVLTYEESFDVLVCLHLSLSHGGVEEMSEHLKKNYYIPEMFINLFLESCNICSNNTVNMDDSEVFKTFSAEINKKAKNSKALQDSTIMAEREVRLDILNMSYYSDKEFSYVLVYIDLLSEFTLLRPLSSLDAEEVAMELYRIYTDFGAPNVIESSDKVFIKNLYKVLQQMPLKFSVKKIIESELTHTRSQKVTEELDSWIKKYGNSDWGLGCYIIQHTLNTIGEGGQSPMEHLFGRRLTLKPNDETTDEITFSSDEKEVIKMETNNDDENTNEQEETLDEDVDIIKEEIFEESEVVLISSAPQVVRTQAEDCVTCNKPIRFTSHSCHGCRRKVHIFCAKRVSVPDSPFSKCQILCTKCVYLSNA